MLIFAIIGAIAVLAIALLVLAFAIGLILMIFSERKTNLLKESLISELSSIARYCDPEFPQIVFMAEEFINRLNNKNTYRMYGNEFREQLYRKFSKQYK